MGGEVHILSAYIKDILQSNPRPDQETERSQHHRIPWYTSSGSLTPQM